MDNYKVLIQECKDRIDEIIKDGEVEFLDCYMEKLEELEDEWEYRKAAGDL